MKTSEQLLKAMELFGPNGENWSDQLLCQVVPSADGTTVSHKYCLLGGLRKVTIGDSGASNCYEDSLEQEPASVRLLHKLLTNQGLVDIPHFNDLYCDDHCEAIDAQEDYTTRIKPVLCEALKVALAEEEHEAIED